MEWLQATIPRPVDRRMLPYLMLSGLLRRLGHMRIQRTRLRRKRDLNNFLPLILLNLSSFRHPILLRPILPEGKQHTRENLRRLVLSLMIILQNLQRFVTSLLGVSFWLAKCADFWQMSLIQVILETVVLLKFADVAADDGAVHGGVGLHGLVDLSVALDF